MKKSGNGSTANPPVPQPEPKSLLVKMRDWGLITASISLIVTLGNSAFTERASNAVTANKVERLEKDISDVRTEAKAITAELQAIKLQLAAASPTRPASQAAASAVLKRASESNAPIAEDVLRNAGEGFLRVAATEPGAWDVLAQLVNYASEVTVWRNEVKRVVAKAGYKRCLSDAIPVGSRMEYSRKRGDVTFVELNYRECVVQLDDPEVQSAPLPLTKRTFYRCLVKYGGGPIVVAGEFRDSVFEIAPARPPSDSGLIFAKNILASPARVTAP